MPQPLHPSLYIATCSVSIINNLYNDRQLMAYGYSLSIYIMQLQARTSNIR